jgi:hypothetical protein
MMSKACINQKLVSNSLCEIKYCADCGTVHLLLGAMTLHLTDDQFEGLTKSFRRAIRRKRVIDRSPPAPLAIQDNVVSFPIISQD